MEGDSIATVGSRAWPGSQTDFKTSSCWEPGQCSKGGAPALAKDKGHTLGVTRGRATGNHPTPHTKPNVSHVTHSSQGPS